MCNKLVFKNTISLFLFARLMHMVRVWVSCKRIRRTSLQACIPMRPLLHAETCVSSFMIRGWTLSVLVKNSSFCKLAYVNKQRTQTQQHLFFAGPQNVYKGLSILSEECSFCKLIYAYSALEHSNTCFWKTHPITHHVIFACMHACIWTSSINP